MLLVRRRFLHLAGAALALPAVTRTALAQAAPATPKLTLLLRTDLQGQEQKVQETVVNLLEMAPGVSAPWHMHPGAQEIIFVLDGALAVEVEGQGTKKVSAGEIVLIPAEISGGMRQRAAPRRARRPARSTEPSGKGFPILRRTTAPTPWRARW